jgi:hypothetical protein
MEILRATLEKAALSLSQNSVMAAGGPCHLGQTQVRAIYLESREIAALRTLKLA